MKLNIHNASNQWFGLLVRIVAALIIACCVSSVDCLQAAQNDGFFKFKHYTVNSGLSVNGVYCITQDSKGFMWFGTLDGLNRFDGDHIKVFLPQNEFMGEIGNNIHVIAEDDNDYLWVGTDMGLCLLDMRKERFELFQKTAEDGTKINAKVYSIIKSKVGDMWIGTYGQGLFKYSFEDDKLTRYHHQKDTNSLCSDKVRRVYEDSRGDIWIVTPDNGYNRLSLETNTFEHYVLDNVDSDMRDDIFYEDSQGNFWLGTFTLGLFCLDRDNRQFKGYLQPGTADYVLHIRSIMEYEPGKLLIASDDGLVYFTTSTGAARIQKEAPKDYSGLSDNYLYCIYKDRNGGIWVGTYFGGVNYFTAEFNNFGYIGTAGSMPGKIVSVLEEDRNNNLWIGTDDAGVIHYNPTDGTYKHYMPTTGDEYSLSYHNIHAIYSDSEKVWIGTFSFGLDVLDLKTGRVKNYQSTESENSLSYSSVYAIYKDHNGNMWFGTPWGLNRYRPATDDFERIPELNACDVQYIIQDKSGYLWVATLTDGLFRYDMKMGEWKNYRFEKGNHNSLPSNKIVTMAQDEKGRLWVGTIGSGICRYDSIDDSFVRYPDLELPSGVVHSIIPDYGYLWISTNKGLVRFNSEDRSTRIYSKNSCLLLSDAQFSPNAGLKTSDGKLYFGSINGLVFLTPDKFVETLTVDPVAITNLQIWNKDAVIGEKGSPLNESTIYQNHIKLSHKQSVIGFEVATFNYSSPSGFSYYYKLEGLDKEWNELNRESRISYTNLLAGEYKFKVVSKSSDSEVEPSVTVMTITVLPHPLASNVAYAVYMILLLLVAYISYRYFTRRVKEAHQKEISFIQSSKEKELYDSKLTFFTYIVHEIRTPLSLIIAPLEKVLKSSKSNVEDVRPELEVMKRNSKRILELVNQLMDFRKVESGMLYLKPARTEITSIIKNTYETFKLGLGPNKFEFILNLPNDEIWCDVDAEAFVKIVSNLLSNAVKFNDGIVKLTVSEHEKEGYVEISVFDNGKGISQEEQKRVFDPFYQIAGTPHHEGRGAGTGIGLTIVKSLVDRMNGYMSLDSSPDSGTVFSVTFPLSTERLTQAESKQTADQKEVLKEMELDLDIPVGMKPYSLLVVDDNEELRLFMAQQLSEFYSVDTANDGRDALNKIAENSYNLIITDVMMPDIDGFELCKRVKENLGTSHIPIIMLTAKTNIEARIEGLEQGADVYIEKPFSMDFILAQIRSLLMNREKLMNAFSEQPLASYLSIASSKADVEFLEKLKETIDENISDSEFMVEDLAHQMNMSRSVFYDKVRGISGLTPNELIRVARLKRAAELFAGGESRVNEVCYLVGFNSPSYFSKCFYNQFGMLPTDFIGLIKEAKPSSTIF